MIYGRYNRKANQMKFFKRYSSTQTPPTVIWTKDTCNTGVKTMYSTKGNNRFHIFWIFMTSRKWRVQNSQCVRELLNNSLLQKWVQINYLHVSSVILLSVLHPLVLVSLSEVMSSFMLYIRHSLGLPLFLFPSNLTRSALCWIRSTCILSKYSGAI